VVVPAQRPGLVVFVAADLTDGGIAGVAQGVEQAARAIGWPLRILDGQGTARGQTDALGLALALRPAGIILGGVDATGQRAALRKAQGIYVVGWHSAVRPGPDPNAGLFTDVTPSAHGCDHWTHRTIAVRRESLHSVYGGFAFSRRC
jgi:ribose transport system substrate-binding protein